jgi:hypothetical protein
LANKAGKSAEHFRLFSHGLTQGRAFLKLASEGRFTQADLHSAIPSGFLMVMEGPSHDFVLGRLWESTVENALRDVTFDEKRQLVPEEIAKLKAQTKFDHTNCSVLGR